jgi:hypothetical protein
MVGFIPLANRRLLTAITSQQTPKAQVYKLSNRD